MKAGRSLLPTTSPSYDGLLLWRLYLDKALRDHLVLRNAKCQSPETSTFRGQPYFQASTGTRQGYGGYRSKCQVTAGYWDICSEYHFQIQEGRRREVQKQSSRARAMLSVQSEKSWANKQPFYTCNMPQAGVVTFPQFAGRFLTAGVRRVI